MLLTCACRELDIYQRLVLLDTFNQDMFNGNTGIAFENPPCCCRMDIVKQQNRGYFLRHRKFEIFERCAELVRIGVFTVYYNNGFPAFVDKAVNGVFHKRTGVRYLTVFRKDGVMPLIQQGDKLFVIVKDIAVILRSPVDVHLIRIIRKTGIIDIGCSFGSFFAETVRHDKKIFDI